MRSGRSTDPDGHRAGPTRWHLAMAAACAVLVVVFAASAVAIGEPDPLVLAAIFLAPATSGFLIGRCTVSWNDRELVVRNPLRTYRIALSDVRRVDLSPRWARLRPMLVELADHRVVRATALSHDTRWNRDRATYVADELRADARRARAAARARHGT